MPRILAALLRHGSYEQPHGVPSAHLPHPLSDEGREEARRAGAALAGKAAFEGWEVHGVVHSSPLLRAWQTGTIIAETLSSMGGGRFMIETHPALAERSLGAAANLTLEEIAAAVEADPRMEPLQPGWKSRSDFTLPFLGAESLLEAGLRVASCLEAVTRDVAGDIHRDTLLVFVGHGAAFRHAAVHLGVLDVEEVATLSMHHCRPVYLELGREGEWVHIGGQWKLRSGDAPEPE